MGAFLDGLARFFSARRRQAGQGLPLSDDLVDALERRNAQTLRQWLAGLEGQEKKAAGLRALLDKAREMGWTEAELGKLEVHGLYSCGRVWQAYEKAAGFIDQTGFDPDLFVIAASALYFVGRFEDAYRFIQAADAERRSILEARTDYLIMAALICRAANRLDEMKRYIDLARRTAPDDPVVAFNAYGMYFTLGEMESFERVRQEIRENRYPIDQAGFALGIAELAQDNYQEGFRLLELRYGMTEVDRYINPALLGLPRWQGESLLGKTLLISAEQGLGDTIQMARYLPEIERLGALRVLVEAQPEALPLLHANFPALDLIAKRHGQSPGLEFDCWTGMMSLPHLLGATPANIPGKGGYLAVPADSAAYWRERVAKVRRGSRPRIGLAWSGRPTHRDDRRRSIPFARMMEAIRGIDADFFALQTSVPSVHPGNLVDVSEEMVTLADTAALIAEMDWVISVDTAPVHVAGAIGKETWLLLPYRYEWRWGLEGEDNHWYHSVKVLRQPRHDDWDSLLEEVFSRRLPLRAGMHKEE